MPYYLFIIISCLFEWLIFSIALRAISGKLGWRRKWEAWIPGLRIYRLGASVELHREGLFCGVMDLLFFLSALSGLAIREGRVSILTSLFHLVLFIFLFIYRIRIFLQIIKLFGLRKRWILLWLIANWLPLLILGLGKKYRPQWERIAEESWQAGSAPAQIPDVLPAAASQAEGLSLRLRERTVRDSGKKRYLLKDIALDIPPKSLVLLLGGSGSGKTTLINALIGYEKAKATVLLNGADVYRDYQKVKYKIGYVPQQNLIRKKDTVIRTVEDAADLRLPTSVSKAKRNEKIQEVMELLGLSAGQDGLVSKKSGGQLRRICIAMELVTDPELFVLDEPDSGLDGAISREIFTKLRQIANEDRIVIVITHTPDRVIDLFDKVIVLGRDSGRVGRLSFYGSPQEAREFFEKETMEQIIVSVNAKEEGGEGRADEMIEKYADYAVSREGGAAL